MSVPCVMAGRDCPGRELAPMRAAADALRGASLRDSSESHNLATTADAVSRGAILAVARCGEQIAPCAKEGPVGRLSVLLIQNTRRGRSSHGCHAAQDGKVRMASSRCKSRRARGRRDAALRRARKLGTILRAPVARIRESAVGAMRFSTIIHFGWNVSVMDLDELQRTGGMVTQPPTLVSLDTNVFVRDLRLLRAKTGPPCLFYMRRRDWRLSFPRSCAVNTSSRGVKWCSSAWGRSTAGSMICRSCWVRGMITDCRRTSASRRP
jgi:hypothetical protein